MNTGRELEDLDAAQLFNLAVAELYRVAELSAETLAARENIDAAIEMLSSDNETDDDMTGMADMTSPSPGPQSPSWNKPPEPPPSRPVSDVRPGQQMGSFDDLVL